MPRSSRLYSNKARATRDGRKRAVSRLRRDRDRSSPARGEVESDLRDRRRLTPPRHRATTASLRLKRRRDRGYSRRLVILTVVLILVGIVQLVVAFMA